MIKTVQVEERRVICDICQKSWYNEKSIPIPEGWVLLELNGPKLDFCPECAKKIRTLLNRGNQIEESTSQHNEDDISQGSSNGEERALEGFYG